MSFNTNGPIGGTAISHVPGSTDIILNETGVYSATYMVSAAAQNQFSLWLNGTVIAGSRYGSGNNPQSRRTTGQAIFTVITVPSILTLRNDNSSGPITLDPTAGGALLGTSASVLIRKLT